MNKNVNNCEKKMNLKKILVALDEKWEAEVNELEAVLEKVGIACIRYNGITNERHDGTVCIRYGGMDRNEERILITDDRELAKEASEAGEICIGVDCEQNGFFEGAILATDSLKSLDVDLLQEVFLHEKGLPVTIGETERLIIREMTQADFADLCRISRQDGMEYLMLPGMRTEDFFNEESLTVYCQTAYRFYGYGLWSVLLKDGTVIGCCGIQDICMKDLLGINPDSSYVLELEYMVDEAYRRKGYAEEMCRAVLRYAHVRTEADAICVRCHPDNRAAIGLAKKLCFFHKKSDEKEVKILLRKMT